MTLESIKLPSKTELFKQLSAIGFTKAYILKRLPQWIDLSLVKSQSGFIELLGQLQKWLGIAAFFDDKGSVYFQHSRHPRKFKKKSTTDNFELELSSSVASALSNIVLREIASQPLEFPRNPNALRAYILDTFDTQYISFDVLLKFCTQALIPVLNLTNLPTRAKRFEGQVSRHSNLYSIVLGYRYLSPSRQLFVLAHELGHIFCHHLKNDGFIIDEYLDHLVESHQPSNSKDKEEEEADTFALTLLRGQDFTTPDWRNGHMSAPQLAALSLKESKQQYVDAGHLIHNFAYDTKNYPVASDALKFVEHQQTAHKFLSSNFHALVDKIQSSTDMYSIDNEDINRLMDLQFETK